MAAHARDAGARAPGRRHPLHRAADQARSGAGAPGRRAGRLKPLIIDESDGELSSFPAALRSATAASPARTARASTNRSSTPPASPSSTRRPGSREYFMSAEDLTTLAGVSVQQDLALVVAAGADPCRAQRPSLHRWHVVRAEREQADFARAHPDLYDHTAGPARLRIDGGAADARLTRLPGLCGGGRTWTLPPCGRCRPRRASRITPALPGESGMSAPPCRSASSALPRSRTS